MCTLIALLPTSCSKPYRLSLSCSPDRQRPSACIRLASSAVSRRDRSTGSPSSHAWPLAGSSASEPASIRFTLRPAARLDRSEEHTSELQSLMRISYAVFCLKKKQKKKNKNTQNYYQSLTK